MSGISPFRTRFEQVISDITILWCNVIYTRRRQHASEVRQLFSTRSLSDVSWDKVCCLTEWRNTPGRPGCKKGNAWHHLNDGMQQLAFSKTGHGASPHKA
jgi:hypothetical protein